MDKQPVLLNTIIALLTLFSFSHVDANKTLTVDSLARRLMYQVWSFPQEKVYVSTDRTAYIAGDTVRFRAFLVDANTHAKPSNPSKYIYLELLNPFGKRVEQIKIKESDGIFAGTMPLDNDIPEGNYTLCAYTQFMQNSGKEYFFRKTIPILSQLSGKYIVKSEIKNESLQSV